MAGSAAGERSPPQTSSSPPTSPSDVPSAPLLLALEDVSDSSVTVSWEPPESLGRLGLQGYVLELCQEGGELWAKPCVPPGEVGLRVSWRQAPAPAAGPVFGGDIPKEKVQVVPSTRSPTASCSPHGSLRQGGYPNDTPLGDPHPHPPAPGIL